MQEPAAQSPPTENSAVFALITPEDWYRIPIQPRERREASVASLIARQWAGVDDQPILRRKAEEQVLGAAEAGAEQGGIVLYLSFLQAAGIPLSASLLVSRIPQRLDSLDAVTALAGRGEVTPVTLPGAGQAARTRRSERNRRTKKLGSQYEDTIVEYFVPVPGRDETLMLTFSTPMEPIADALVELFDAIAGSLRWRRQTEEP
jgi:hypothetical protein